MFPFYYLFIPGNPGHPEQLTASGVTADRLTLTWKPPTSDGGAPVLYYVIKQKKNDSEGNGFVKVCEIDATKTSCIVQSLLENSPYLFSIEACNEAGLGEPLLTEEAVVTKAATSRNIYLFIICFKSSSS